MRSTDSSKSNSGFASSPVESSIDSAAIPGLRREDDIPRHSLRRDGKPFLEVRIDRDVNARGQLPQMRKHVVERQVSVLRAE